MKESISKGDGHMEVTKPLAAFAAGVSYNKLPVDVLTGIYAYLKSITAIHNKVPPPPDPAGKPMS